MFAVNLQQYLQQANYFGKGNHFLVQQTFLVSLEELKKCTHHIPCSIIRVSAGRTKSSEPADHLRLKTTIPGILIPVREHNSFVRR